MRKRDVADTVADSDSGSKQKANEGKATTKQTATKQTHKKNKAKTNRRITHFSVYRTILWCMVCFSWD